MFAHIQEQERMAEGFSLLVPHLIQTYSHMEDDDEGSIGEEDSMQNEKELCNDVRDGLVQSSSEEKSKQESWKIENGSDNVSSSNSSIVQKIASSKKHLGSSNSTRGTFPLTHQELLHRRRWEEEEKLRRRFSDNGSRRQEEQEDNEEEDNEDEDEIGSLYGQSIKSEPDAINQITIPEKKKSRRHHKLWKKFLPPWSSVKTNVKIHSTASRCDSNTNTIPQTIITKNTTLAPTPAPAPSLPAIPQKQEDNHTRQVSSLSTTPFASLEEDIADFLFDTVARSSTNANVTAHLRKEREKQHAYKVEKLHQQQQKQKLYDSEDSNHTDTKNTVRATNHNTTNHSQPTNSDKETISKHHSNVFKAKDSIQPLVFDGNIEEYYLQRRAANNDTKQDIPAPTLSKCVSAPENLPDQFSSSLLPFEKSKSQPMNSSNEAISNQHPAFVSYFDHHQKKLIADKKQNEDDDTKHHKRGGSGRSSCRRLHRRYFSLQKEELEMALQGSPTNDSLEEQQEDIVSLLQQQEQQDNVLLTMGSTMTTPDPESISNGVMNTNDNTQPKETIPKPHQP